MKCVYCGYEMPPFCPFSMCGQCGQPVQDSEDYRTVSASFRTFNAVKN